MKKRLSCALFLPAVLAGVLLAVSCENPFYRDFLKKPVTVT
ncbi:hypothetical protein [Brucepastera parasyntrophica]|nr:hypothetical protein [Brucepastera parasyntrophica]